MRRVPAIVALLLSVIPSFAAETAPAPRPVARPATAFVESSLATGTNRIRQFAFDGDADTYFASEKNATRADHFTLTFDAPANVKSVRVVTGRPKGGDALTSGVVEVSIDGKTFEELATFAEGAAAGTPKGKVKAVRVRPTDDLKHPLVIREISVDADPAVTTFRYPIEFVVDVTDAPELKEWAEKTARVCERQYPMICAELMSDGFLPLAVIRMTLKNDYAGVAAAGGGRITGSVKYFKGNRTTSARWFTKRFTACNCTARGTTRAGSWKASRTTCGSSNMRRRSPNRSPRSARSTTAVTARRRRSSRSSPTSTTRTSSAN